MNLPLPLSLYSFLVFQSKKNANLSDKFHSIFFLKSNKARMSKFHVGGIYLIEGV